VKIGLGRATIPVWEHKEPDCYRKRRSPKEGDANKESDDTELYEALAGVRSSKEGDTNEESDDLEL
jgi:hypothetical protein